jgi:hypothetical protein
MYDDMWSVVSGGQLVGSFPEGQLVAWAASGQVNPNDLFYRDGMRVAAPAHTLDPFRRYFPPRPLGPATKLGDDPAMRWLMPVGRAPWALAAGYLGLFSILGVFGPFALVAGLLAVRQIRRDRSLHGMGRAIFGIVMGSLATLLLVAFLLSR